jgi:hypothetical protein
MLTQIAHDSNRALVFEDYYWSVSAPPRFTLGINLISQIQWEHYPCEYDIVYDLRIRQLTDFQSLDQGQGTSKGAPFINLSLCLPSSRSQTSQT